MKKRPPGEILQLTKPHALQFPLVDDLTCIEVTLPNDLAYVALLQGFVAQMTNYWSYQGTTAERKAVAQLMLNAYTLTDWENCMNCEELTACLTPLLEAQTAQITNNILNQIQYGNQNPGQPMSGEQSGSNLANGTNPTCDLDILWAQCLSIIQYTNSVIVDVLQQVEAATNTVELAGLIDAIPALGLLAELFGSELATDALNYYQEAVEEQYNAQYTSSVEIDLACQLFCMARNDCVLSVDLIFGLFAQRVVSIIPETPSDLVNLIEIVAGVSFDNTIVVDLAFYFAWGTAKLGQFLFGEPIATRTLEVLVQTAKNDASSDWETLCDGCPALAQNVGILVDCGSGVKSSVEFTSGTPFTITAYEDTGGGNWIIALRLPPGNWSISLDDFDGTPTNPSSSETAYAWHDETGTFHNVLWSAGSPADFPADTLTTRTVFDPWCDSAAWNVMMNNGAPFNATFTATLVV